MELGCLVLSVDCWYVCLSVCSHFPEKMAEDISTKLGSYYLATRISPCILKVKVKASRLAGEALVMCGIDFFILVRFQFLKKLGFV